MVANERVLECAKPWLLIDLCSTEVRKNITNAMQRQAEIQWTLNNHAEAAYLLEQGLQQSAPVDQPRVRAQLIVEQLAASS